MYMKKLLILTLALASQLIMSGCAKNIDIANIPFDVLEKNDFTIEELAKNIKQPLMVATDKQKDFDKILGKIKKNAEQSKIIVNEKDEIILALFRGNAGSCHNADLTINKISRVKKTVYLEVTIDKNQAAEKESCKLVMNPYSIVKIKKSNMQYSSGLKIQMVDYKTKNLLAACSLNDLPGILK